MAKTRLPRQPKRSEFTDPADIEAYDHALSRYTGTPVPDFHDMGQYFGALLTSPLLCAIAGDMGRFVRTAGDRDDTYSHADREFVDQILSKDWKTNVVQVTHIQDALSTGVRMEAIEAIRAGREDELDDTERLLAKYIRQVVSGTVDDATWEAMVGYMGQRGVVEYTGFVLWLQWIIRMMQTLGVDDPSEEEIDQLIADLKSGVREVPNYRARIR
ncbi:MAG TPA: hypothetical protein VNQ73_03735 [Ilumatobacter sp.]|nr:hypothetical protein [Ilumatobacter sp.]